MKKYLVVIFCSVIFITSLIACYPNYGHLNIQPRVVNLEELNTEYDAFNSTGPPTYLTDKDLIFSTNSLSQGDNYSIKYSHINLQMEWDGSELDGEPTNQHTFELEVNEPVSFLGDEVNSKANEYGPYIMHPDNDRFRIDKDNPNDFEEEIIYFVASDRAKEELFNIYYYTKDDGLNQFAGNDETANDYYLTYHHDSNTIYFCSNRNGSYDIYAYHDESADDIRELLEKEIEAEAVKELNSDYEDKTPYIFEDIMVFVSNRGGDNFDIYFSKFEGGKWSEPQNLPQKIDIKTDESFHYLNSNYNEYRPALFSGRLFFETDRNKTMIFSSDRPGGKGGYDLYLAVLPLDIFD